MEPENKLDKLFNERFSDLEMDPSTDGWPVIESRLNGYKKKRGAIFWRWAATAAAIVIAFFSGYYWQLNDSRPQPEALDTIEVPIPVASSPDESKSTDFKELNRPSSGGSSTSTNEAKPHSPTKVAVDQKRSNPIENQKQRTSKPAIDADPGDQANQALIDNSITEAIPAIAMIEAVTPDKASTMMSSGEEGKTSIPDSAMKTSLVRTEIYLSDKNKLQLPTNSELKKYPVQSISGLSLGMAVSPTFAFNSVNINDQADVATMNINNDKIAPSFTAGIELGYRGKKRWSFETGVFINQWTQSNDRLVARTEVSAPTAQVSIYSNNSTGNLLFNDDENPEKNFASRLDALFLVPELSESYTYLEIPVSVSYYLIEGMKWSWKLKGGMSSRFLTNSSVQLNFEDGRTENVENLPLNSFSLQLLMGTGVEYRLIPKLRLNITPSIQYGLTPVNQHDVVDTYFHQFLIYSGLSYML